MLTLGSDAIASVSHVDLLDRASRGERVLLLLPGMEEASRAFHNLADPSLTPAPDWRVVRTNGAYAVHHRAGGWIRVHTSHSDDFARGQDFDHARVFVHPTKADRVRETLMPGLIVRGGELELHLAV